MKRFSTAQARQRLAELLDSAEAGQAVVIERHGVRFVLQADRARRPRRRRWAATIEVVDPAIEAGQWTWEWRRGGLAFSTRRRRR